MSSFSSKKNNRKSKYIHDTKKRKKRKSLSNLKIALKIAAYNKHSPSLSYPSK